MTECDECIHTRIISWRSRSRVKMYREGDEDEDEGNGTDEAASGGTKRSVSKARTKYL